MVKFIRQFCHYLLGHRFLLRTDHNCLVWLMSFKNPEGQLGGWLEELSQFDFQIIHRQSKRFQRFPVIVMLQGLCWNHCPTIHVIMVPRFILNGRDSKRMLMMLFKKPLRIQLVV